MPSSNSARRQVPRCAGSFPPLGSASWDTFRRRLLREHSPGRHRRRSETGRRRLGRRGYPEDKLPPRMRASGVGRWAVRADGSADLWINYYADVSLDQAIPELAKFKARVIGRNEKLNRFHRERAQGPDRSDRGLRLGALGRRSSAASDGLQ